MWRYQTMRERKKHEEDPPALSNDQTVLVAIRQAPPPYTSGPFQPPGSSRWLCRQAVMASVRKRQRGVRRDRKTNTHSASHSRRACLADTSVHRHRPSCVSRSDDPVVPRYLPAPQRSATGKRNDRCSLPLLVSSLGVSCPSSGLRSSIKGAWLLVWGAPSYVRE